MNENINQKTLIGCEDYAKKREVLTVEDVIKMRNKAESEIKKILIGFIEDSGIIPEIKTEVSTIKSTDCVEQFSGIKFEIGIRL